MSWVAALILLATGVFLPTFDVYSDLFLAIKLFVGNYYGYEPEWNRSGIEPEWTGQWDKCKTTGPPHPSYGSAMLAPFLLSWVFVTIQWFKTERGLSQKLKTLPLLICQVYPQWRALRVLYYAKWKRDTRWQRMKEEWETDISFIGKNIFFYLNFGLNTFVAIFPEPFLESVPQVHMLLIIRFISPKYDCNSPIHFGPQFSLTFWISIATASFGIAKFVKSGPARIVNNDKCLMGFGTLSFILIFTNIAQTVLCRAWVIAIFVGYAWVQEANRNYLPLILLCFIPQLLHVSSNFILLGTNK